MALLLKMAGDLVAVNGGYILAFLLRFGYLPERNWEAYVQTSPWISLLAIIIFSAYDLYLPDRQRWDEIFASLVASCGVVLVASIAMSYLTGQFAFPRTVLFLAALTHLACLSAWRRLLWWRNARAKGPCRLLIAGSAFQAPQRAAELAPTESALYRVVGLVVDIPPPPSDPVSTWPSWSYTELNTAITATAAEQLLICADISPAARSQLVTAATARGLPVFIIPEFMDILLAHSRLSQFDGIPVLELRATAPRRSALWKRTADIILALVLAPPAALVALVASVALKIESPRDPILFRQERVGQGGKIFALLKLRTMIHDAEKHTGPVLSTPADPRITPVGRVLRATRIDELPQIINVLRGDMSFVGPRPERPVFVTQLRQDIPGYDDRHQVEVGITGLAQVEGKYSTRPEDKLRYDYLYARRGSLLQDFYILLRTVKVILLRRKVS